MKQVWLLVVVFVFFNLLRSQEVKHAPTVEQCRADQRLWLDKLESDIGHVSVSYKELIGWSREMSDCKSVDPEFKVRYYNILSSSAH